MRCWKSECIFRVKENHAGCPILPNAVCSYDQTFLKGTWSFSRLSTQCKTCTQCKTLWYFLTILYFLSSRICCQPSGDSVTSKGRIQASRLSARNARIWFSETDNNSGGTGAKSKQLHKGSRMAHTNRKGQSS